MVKCCIERSEGTVMGNAIEVVRIGFGEGRRGLYGRRPTAAGDVFDEDLHWGSGFLRLWRCGS